MLVQASSGLNIYAITPALFNLPILSQVHYNIFPFKMKDPKDIENCFLLVTSCAVLKNFLLDVIKNGGTEGKNPFTAIPCCSHFHSFRMFFENFPEVSKYFSNAQGNFFF